MAVAVYQATERFPRAEIYVLTSQLRRACVSVAANIAEGQGRLTKGEFRHFLGLVRGSLLELETELDIAFDLGYLDHESHALLQQRSYQILGLLNRLLASLRTPVLKTETLKLVKP